MPLEALSARGGRARETAPPLPQTKGRFEASIRMPVNNATGAWPAWWLLPEGECWPVSGEIDIVEWYAGQGHNQHSRPANPAQMSSSYHYGYCCGCDLYHCERGGRGPRHEPRTGARAPVHCADPPKDPNDTVWWPSGDWEPNSPIIDFSASFNTFGVEINDTAVRFYVNDATNTIMTMALPPLCLTDPDFVWGKSAYMPFKPLYGILNVAVAEVSHDVDLSWWLTHNATTLIDWVRWYEYVPGEVGVAVA